MGSFQREAKDSDNDFDSEDLDDDQIGEMNTFSAAASIKFQGIISDLKRTQSTRPALIEDSKHTEVFNTELAHMKEFLHDPTYNAALETLHEADAA